ncbi:hypothetical protein OIU74_006429 [Salix koriyanagi]|uniref:Uncharacterized protein n=1 Tax=Salix koriyanagi TaxID=2511006 RepID=A0A9Q0UE85_9ROSI|nr:hypothetical protein OIU74_006429 [Salix koriyanagi]
MMNEMRYMQKWGDVAPALLLSRQRSRSSSPKLDTIVEEGSGNFGVVAMPRRALLSSSYCSFFRFIFPDA